MNSDALVLFLSSTMWRFGIASRAVADRWSDTTPLGTADASAEAIVAAVASFGARGPLTIAIASDDCFSAIISIDDLPRRDRRQAMIYRLEEQFPLAAEDFACDFIESRDHRRALGVATRVAGHAELIAAIEMRGQPVSSVTPAAMLTLASIETRSEDAVVWASESGLELVAIDDGRPIAWYSPADEAALSRHVAVLAAKAGRPVRVWAAGIDAAPLAVIARHATVDVEAEFDPLAALLAAAGRRADIERRGGWIELRRDGLAATGRPTALGRSLAFAAAGLAILFVSVGIAALFRAAAHDRTEQATNSRLQAIYAELFPHTPTPVAIRSRLTSEARRLAAPIANNAVTRPTTVRTLFNLLARVPRDGGFSVTELRVAGEDAAVTLEGEAKSFGDAQAFAAAIRGELPSRVASLVEAAGLRFDVEPPRTTQRPDRSVSFALTAKPSPLAASSPSPKLDVKVEPKPIEKNDSVQTTPAEPPKPTAKSLEKPAKHGAKR